MSVYNHKSKVLLPPRDDERETDTKIPPWCENTVFNNRMWSENIEGIKMEKAERNYMLHKDICEELSNTYKNKNADYGDTFGMMHREFGFTQSAIRLTDKLNRFKTLINSKVLYVKSESIEDTLLDMANYAIMTVMEMRKEKQEYEGV